MTPLLLGTQANSIPRTQEDNLVCPRQTWLNCSLRFYDTLILWLVSEQRLQSTAYFSYKCVTTPLILASGPLYMLWCVVKMLFHFPMAPYFSVFSSCLTCQSSKGFPNTLRAYLHLINPYPYVPHIALFIICNYILILYACPFPLDDMLTRAAIKMVYSPMLMQL